MTGEKFLIALNGIDDCFITEYQDCSVKKNHTIYRRLAPIAACFAVAVCAAVGYYYTNTANPPVKPNTTENTPVQPNTTEASNSAPTVSSEQKEDSNENDDGNALCFSHDTVSISEEEALKNPDLAKYLPQSEYIKIRYVHYVPEYFKEHEPNMFVEGTVLSDDNREVRFMFQVRPRDSADEADEGFLIKALSRENFEWDSVLEQYPPISIFGDGYSFYCHSDKLHYYVLIGEKQTDVFFKLIDTLK